MPGVSLPQGLFLPPRVATLYVAAADATARSRAQADFLCTGVNDHLVIQAALDALPAAGGEVALSEGTFNVEASINLDSNQTLRGCGHNTILTTATLTAPIISAVGGAMTELVHILIADLQIDGASTSYAGIYWDYVDYSKISNVFVHDCTYNKGVTEWGGLQLCNCDYDELLENIIADNWFGICLSDYIASDYPCTFITIAENIVLGNINGGIYVGFSNNNTIVGNTCQGNGFGIFLPDSNNNIVSSNICSGSADSGITLANGVYNNTIVGNTCQGNVSCGIYLVYANNTIISGNICQGNGGCGIYLEGHVCDNNTITGNICLENSQLADVNYDNILLNASDYNLIAGNICRRGALANKPRYGINISNATCDHNMIHGNNLYDSGSTGDLNDAGTNTHKRDNLSNVGAWLADV